MGAHCNAVKSDLLGDFCLRRRPDQAHQSKQSGTGQELLVSEYRFTALFLLIIDFRWPWLRLGY